MKSLLLVLVLAPSLAFAATSTKQTKKAATATTQQTAPAAAQTATTEPAQQTSYKNETTTLNLGDLKGLSIFGAYDMNDKVVMSEGPNGGVEKVFMLGGQYQFQQFEPGTALQVGGTYEFDRKIKNANNAKLSLNTAFAEVDLRLTPKASVSGGLNYSFPSLSGMEGVTISGKMGYQFGASYAANHKLSIDAKYRIVSTELSANNRSADADLKGLAFYGRYAF